MSRHTLTPLLLLLFLPLWAHAHVGDAPVAGLLTGLLHPIHGLDHLLAMLAIGIWAGILGGRARCLLPTVFPLLMVLGATLGVTGGTLPGIEVGIALSVVIGGLLILLYRRLPMLWATPLVGLFGFVHGHAHGTELPVASDPILYAVGFLIATIALLLAGVGVAALLRQPRGVIVLRIAGGVVAASGLMILVLP